MSNLRELLTSTADRVVDYRGSLAERRVAPVADLERLRAELGGPLPAEGADAAAVLDELAAAVEPALMSSAGPRFFGFVVGGSLDAAVGADILTTGWDQLAFNGASSPAAALVEEIVGAWLKESLGLPDDASVGIVTGTQAGNTVGLSAARHRVLERAGWDVERDGLHGAPRVRVIAGEERHATIDRSLRLLGLGVGSMEAVRSDANGAVDADALVASIEAGSGEPTIVIVQAGNVNTGAFDDLVVACEAARRQGAWVHVDGRSACGPRRARRSSTWSPVERRPTPGCSTATSG
jgi:glutamate/tyrosine decarboxylase-like PLP-dependent enzyme